MSEQLDLQVSPEYAARIARAVTRTENMRGNNLRITEDAIEIVAENPPSGSDGSNDGIRLLWVKITGDETGGGKYQGKSYTHDGTTDVAATGNVAESELGTLSDTVDCRVLNLAEESETTHDLTAGTPEIDTFLCHWFRTNSDGIKVCAVVAYDRETCP